MTEPHTDVIDRIESEASKWPGVSGEHRSYGGCEFSVGTEPFGYLHDEPAVDCLFPKRVREVLIAEGRAEQYQVSPDPEWLLFPVDSEADVEHAVWLLRLSYLHRAIVTPNRDAINPDLAILDLEDEIADVKPSEALRAVFYNLLHQHSQPYRGLREQEDDGPFG